MTTMINCPNCDSADTHAIEFPTVVKDFKTRAEYAMQAVGMFCDNCEQQFATSAQVGENEVRLADARGAAIGAPTREQIKQLRKDWDKMSQEVAGQLFGGGKVAFCKYETGALVPAQAMARLLALAVCGRIKRTDLEQAADGSLLRSVAVPAKASMPANGGDIVAVQDRRQPTEIHEIEVGEDDRYSHSAFVAWTQAKLAGDLTAQARFKVTMAIYRAHDTPEVMQTPLLVPGVGLGAYKIWPRQSVEVAHHEI